MFTTSQLILSVLASVILSAGAASAVTHYASAPSPTVQVATAPETKCVGTPDVASHRFDDSSRRDRDARLRASVAAMR